MGSGVGLAVVSNELEAAEHLADGEETEALSSDNCTGSHGRGINAGGDGGGLRSGGGVGGRAGG